MATVHLYKYNPNFQSYIWNYVDITPQISSGSGSIDVEIGTVVTVTLSLEVEWTPINAGTSIENYVYVDDENDIEIPHTYSNGVYQFTVTEDTYISIKATTPGLFKIKKFFEKITTAIRDIDEIGQGAEIYGKNSAGTGDCSLQKQTYQNPLAGQCNGRLYQADGSLTTATTTVQQNDLFVVTPSTGKIKVLKAGTYLVAAQAYAYNGFTAGDLFKMVVQKGSTNLIQFYALERMSDQYQIIFDTRCITLSANDELNIGVTNDAAARGKVVSSISTSLEIIKVT